MSRAPETHFSVAEASRRSGLTEATLRNAIQRGYLAVDRERRARRIYIAAEALCHGRWGKSRCSRWGK